MGGYENAEHEQTQTAAAPLWLRLLPDPSPGGARATLGAAAAYKCEHVPQVLLALLAVCGLLAVEAVQPAVFVLLTAVEAVQPAVVPSRG